MFATLHLYPGPARTCLKMNQFPVQIGLEIQTRVGYSSFSMMKHKIFSATTQLTIDYASTMWSFDEAFCEHSKNSQIVPVIS